ncbi:MAG: MBL fold metallo-hydrolase [Alphaproteobacteria bacterium]|nr:MBL fold metallo-hydrolase [Alphaproteobacteria bacterium]
MPVDYDIIVRGNNLSFEGGFFGLANATLVMSTDGPVLFDTGHYCNQPALLAGLARHSMTPGDIRAVFLSHLHFDHCNNIHLFPGARVYVSRREWDYAAAPHGDDPFIPWLIRDQLQKYDLELIDGEGRIGDGMHYLPAPGHTPGSFALVLETDKSGRVVLAGDAIKYAKEAITRRCDMAFDTVARGTESIERLLAMADRIVPGHFPELVRRDGVFTWDEPAELTLRIR